MIENVFVKLYEQGLSINDIANDPTVDLDPGTVRWRADGGQTRTRIRKGEKVSRYEPATIPYERMAQLARLVRPGPSGRPSDTRAIAFIAGDLDLSEAQLRNIFTLRERSEVRQKEVARQPLVGQGQVRQVVARAVALATAPEEIPSDVKEKIAFEPVNWNEASHLLIEVTGREGLGRIHRWAIQEMDRLLAEVRQSESTESLEGEQKAVETYTARLREAFAKLVGEAAKTPHPKVYVAVDLPRETQWAGVQEDFVEALHLFGPLVGNVIFSSSDGGRVQVPRQVRELLESFQIKTPVTDPKLKNAAALIELEGQEKLGVFGLAGDKLNWGKLSDAFVRIEHEGRLSFKELGLFEKKALILTKFFLGLAVGLGKEPELLKNEYPDLFNTFRNNPFKFSPNVIRISLEKFRSELRAGQAFKSAA